MKKIVFSTGVEASITDTSSIYLLGIPTKDAAEVQEFKALLTNKNLSSFSIIDEEGNTVDTAENFKFVDTPIPMLESEDRNETNFQLQVMSDIEIKLAELEEEKEIQADAIAELAEMIGNQ